MTRKYFGTDGVRGTVGLSPMTPDFVMRLGYAAGRVLSGQEAHPAVLIGKDTRISGYLMESALEAGFCAAGVDVHMTGPVPTPAVAYLTRALRLSAGVVISASHNPYPDNGIKFFSGDGFKLPDATESAIEAAMDRPMGCNEAGKLGKVWRREDAGGRYIEFCKSTFPNELDLKGMRIVVDCAHGAAYALAPRLLAEAGAMVIPIGVEPDGININEGCGSTHLAVLQAAVTEHGADAGIAYDGDADRCLAVDAAGRIVDGDQILATLALELMQAGRLAGGTVVATVMANLGFRLAMAQAGIDVVETPVGDRYLLAAMLDGKYVLGGEQSGHIIMLDHSSTGDGLLTSIQLLTTAAARGRSIAELGAVMSRVPQVLVNVHGVSKEKVTGSLAVAAAVASAGDELGESGRVLVRPSGPEPAVRVMVEAIDQGKAESIAERLADVVRAEG